ncbi:MAG: hypothetical protein KGM17_09525 [Sphingomonadales bacterium]|nr:hypothetical protein [Sphingomonadales bacterium]
MGWIMERKRKLVIFGTLIGCLLLAGYALLNTHRPTTVSARCDIMRDGWMLPRDGRSAFRSMVVIEAKDRTVRWDEQPVSGEKLITLLMQAHQMHPFPFIVFDSSGAVKNCDFVKNIQRIIHEKSDCHLGGRCGLGTRDEWQHAPPLKSENGIE